MSLRYSSYLLFFFTILSCSNSDEITPLDGYYSLTNISCECTPFDLVPHQQQCKLDIENNILSVRTFFENEEQHVFLSEGEYDVIIDGEEINIDGKIYGLRTPENTLIFDSGFNSGIADLPVYFFKKNE